MAQSAAHNHTSFSCLAQLGFEAPTPIQSNAIPVLDNGQSIFALAATGSGKTLAFLVPLMRKIQSDQSETQLLILAPTRELGLQIAQVAEKVAAVLASENAKSITVRTAFGGAKIETQKQGMERNPHIVIATPGRALDLLQREFLKIPNLKSIVLDEADLMLGMGFEEQIANVCDFLPNKVQTALFSATESELHTRLQNRLAHRSVRIDVRDVDDKKNENAKTLATAAIHAHQYILVENHATKNKKVNEFLRANDSIISSGVIFCQTRMGAKELCERLQANGFLAEELSGGLGQVERSSIMRRFKAKGVKYLIATNIAARGIDVHELSIVINYDLPSTPDEYVHRSGRSGRAGRSGWTLSFCLKNAQDFYFDLMKKNSIVPEVFIQKVETSSEHAPAAANTLQNSSSFLKVHLNKGKSSKLRPGDVVGILVKQMGLSAASIGNIFIFDHFSHVEVETSLVDSVIEGFAMHKIKGMTVKASRARELTAPRARGKNR